MLKGRQVGVLRDGRAAIYNPIIWLFSNPNPAGLGGAISTGRCWDDFALRFVS
jgi:hypothetical protein